MGILDDAIREHLELKRRHGVPEDEVERQEEEALGPARREVAQQPEDPEIAAEAVDDASRFGGEEGDAPVAGEPPTEQPPAETILASAPAVEAPPDEPFVQEPPEAEPPVADHTGLEPPAAEHEPVEPPAVEPPVAEAPPEPEPHEAFGDSEPDGVPALEDELEEDDELEDDELDVLEDTPDFLQETPEHDRLWFEQKPPRDFDFD